jgi:hypothetical protein
MGPPRHQTTVRKTARSHFGSLPPVTGHLCVTVVINAQDTEIVEIVLIKKQALILKQRKIRVTTNISHIASFSRAIHSL